MIERGSDSAVMQSYPDYLDLRERAAWIPAQRALSADPLMLLREQ